MRVSAEILWHFNWLYFWVIYFCDRLWLKFCNPPLLCRCRQQVRSFWCAYGYAYLCISKAISYMYCLHNFVLFKCAINNVQALCIFSPKMLFCCCSEYLSQDWEFTSPKNIINKGWVCKICARSAHYIFTSFAAQITFFSPIIN